MSIPIERLVRVLSDLAEQLKRLKIPFVQGRTEYFITSGLKTITFPTPFKEAPTLIVFIESEKGWYIEDLFSYTRIEIGKIDLPKLDDFKELTLEIEKISVPDYPTQVHDAFEDKVKSVLGEWGILNWARNKIVGAFGAVGRIVGAVLQQFYNKTVFGQTTKTVNALIDRINSVISTIRDDVYSGLKSLRDKAQNALDDTRSKIQGALNIITDHAGEAWNKSIDKLYDMMGLKTGIIVKLAQIENRTATKFVVNSPGPSTIHWVAFGQPYITGPIITDLELIIEEMST